MLVPRHQEAIVLGIEDRAADVVAGEPADRILRFPERQQEKLGPVALDPTECQGALVAGRGAVGGEAGGVEIVEIGVGIGSAGGPGPGASDHVPSESGLAAHHCTSMYRDTGAVYVSGLHL